MVGQGQPFNGDTFIEKKVIELRDRFNLSHAIETGTHYGYTTDFLCKHFKRVITIESQSDYYIVAKKRLEKYNNCKVIQGDSANFLEYILPEVSQKVNIFFFLDAHWYGHCPLKDELKAISLNKNINPVILIHDFQVPGKDFQFDTYNNQPLNLDWIHPELEKIYGEYNFEYNKESTGAKVGVIYIYE